MDKKEIINTLSVANENFQWNYMNAAKTVCENLFLWENKLVLHVLHARIYLTVSFLDDGNAWESVRHADPGSDKGQTHHRVRYTQGET